MCLDLQIVILRNKKSETERQIPYDTTYMRNLKKWYKWTYLQTRNRLTDIENRHVVAKGEPVVRASLGVWDELM